MLEDVQERFVYRTHIYIKEEILNYNPSSGDLAYPEKLEIMQQIAEKLRKASTSSTESSAENKTNVIELTNQSAASVSPADAHGMWYPTLRRSLICLSKLYRCLDVIDRTFKYSTILHRIF
jgi:conserved oligomeric Golgi complex subunit 3